VTIALAIVVARLVGSLQPAERVSFSITHVEDTHPQIIHIYNLDDGPRAIYWHVHNPRMPTRPGGFEFSMHWKKAFWKSSSR